MLVVALVALLAAPVGWYAVHIGPFRRHLAEIAIPRSIGAGGLHVHDGTPVHVSTGIGREQQGAPQIRFLADPSVAIITLG